MGVILGWVFGIVLAVAFIYLMYQAFRIPVRAGLRSWRTKNVGELSWFLIIPETRQSDYILAPESQSSTVKVLCQQLQPTPNRWPYSNRGIASLVWSRGDDDMWRLYIGLDRLHLDDHASIIKNFAAGLNCRAEEKPGPPAINGEGLVVAYRKAYTPSEVKKYPPRTGMVATQLSAAPHVKGAVILTLDTMRSSESQRLEADIAETAVMRQGDSAAFSGAPMAAHIVAEGGMRACIGAASADGNVQSSLNLLNTATLSTSGIQTYAQEPSVGQVKSSFVAALVYLGVCAAGWLLGIQWKVALVCALPGVIVAVLSLAKGDWLAGRWYQRYAERGEVVVPPFMWWSLRWFLHSRSRARFRNRGNTSTRLRAQIAPPSSKQVIHLHPSPITEFASVPENVSSDVATENLPLVGMPSGMAQPKEGIFLGMSGTFQRVIYPIEDIRHGVFVVGAPESGKSNFLQVLYTGISEVASKATSDLQVTALWCETKGEGAYDTWKMVREMPRSVFVDSHNPLSAFRLSLEGRRLSDGETPENIVRNCESLVTAMQFAWGDGIRAASRDLLDHSIRVAMLLLPEEIKRLELHDEVDPDHPNVMRLAYLVLGADVQHQPGPMLIQMREELAIDAKRGDSRAHHLSDSIGRLSMYISADKRAAGLAERISSASNKLSDLQNAQRVWTPDQRSECYIDAIVNKFGPVVLNMGPYWDPSYVNPNGGRGALVNPVSTAVNRRLLLMFGYLLWNYAKAYCSGWMKQGRRISVFFDEVADIAVDSSSVDVPNVFAEATKEGRSRGFAIFAAAQHLGQLPLQAVSEVRGLNTKVYYRQNGTPDAQAAISDLGAGEGRTPFSTQNIKNAPNFIAVASIKQGDHGNSPAFTLLAPDAVGWSRTNRQVPLEQRISEYEDNGGTFGGKTLDGTTGY